MKKPVIADFLPLVTKPTRYTGKEWYASQGDVSRARVSVALVFPDVYEVGMSHLGMQILYGTLNAQPGVVCERVFSPWIDMEAILRRENLPLFSLESHTSLQRFDVIGFSLEYELCYTNVLNVLSLAGIPFYARERGEDMPLIIGGGPCVFNAEPLADFFDAFVLGDGEDAVLEVTEAVALCKEGSTDKTTLLENLASIEGVYVPSHFHVRYDPEGRINAVEPLGKTTRVTKRVVSDLNAADYPRSPVVPYLKVIHDRLSVEIARGCTRGCRFCQAGYIYRPVRERNPDLLLKLIDESLRATGYDELSLLSLSAGDYGCLLPLLRELMLRYRERKVAVSLPSLRVGTLTRDMAEQIKQVRKTGFTIAPEAATERLQRVINKRTDEAEVITTAADVFKAGWNVIKLYFMIGLPGEREEDLQGIIDLTRKVARQRDRIRRRGGVNVSISTFVPKPHTPFQWESQLSFDEIRERQRFLQEHVRGRGLRLKWHDARMSLLEGVFSRGDRRLSSVLVKSWERGCRFDGWTEQLRWHEWEEAFSDAGVDPLFYAVRRRHSDEIMPWMHMDSGVTIEYLREERRRAGEGIVIDDCRRGVCHHCGVCSGDTRLRLTSPRHTLGVDAGLSRPAAEARESAPGRVRMRFFKIGWGRFIGHLDMVTLFDRAARRANLPVKFSEGFHPLPRIRFSDPVPLGVASLAEFLDVELAGTIGAEDCRRRWNAQLPSWLRIVDAGCADGGTPPLPRMCEVERFLVSIGDVGRPFSEDEVQKRVDVVKQSNSLVVSQVRKDAIRWLDARPHIEDLTVFTRERLPSPAVKEWDISLHELLPGDVILEMQLFREGGARPAAVTQAILDLTDDESKKLVVVKTEAHPRSAAPTSYTSQNRQA